MTKEITLKQNDPIAAEVIDALITSSTGVSFFNQGIGYRQGRTFIAVVMEFAELDCKGIAISRQMWRLDKPLFDVRPIAGQEDLFQIKVYYTEDGDVTTLTLDVSGTNQLEIIERDGGWTVAFMITALEQQSARGAKSKMVTFDFTKG